MRRTRRQIRASVCRRKVTYPTWEDAQREGLRIWRSRETTRYPNPALPYSCYECGQYHLANRAGLPRFARWRDRVDRAA